jgi:hypothetical protein
VLPFVIGVLLVRLSDPAVAKGFTVTVLVAVAVAPHVAVTVTV